jgi:hypothetical protein
VVASEAEIVAASSPVESGSHDVADA